LIVEQLSPDAASIEGIMVESTYNWYWLVDGLMEKEHQVHLANTASEHRDIVVGMRQSTFVQPFSLRILYPCLRIPIVNVQCDVFHNCSPPRPVMLTAASEYIAFILISTNGMA
jgi:hypothetical protein